MSNPEVDAYLDRAERWQTEIAALRSILLDCGLDEHLKWRKPCYSFGGTNVAIIQPFKEHCALMFFKGALLEDTHGLLREQGANSRSARRLEFRTPKDVRKSIVRAYLKQAIMLEREARKVELDPSAQPELPAELARAMKKDRELAKAFRALTPGRQRGYLLHFNGAKQPTTRAARIEKCRPRILAGQGLHDR